MPDGVMLIVRLRKLTEVDSLLEIHWSLETALRSEVKFL